MGELRTIARALGEVRDIDVLLEDLDAHIATLPIPGRAGMEPLRQAWRKQREVARTRLIARLDSKQYRQFVEDYLDFTEFPAWARCSRRWVSPAWSGTRPGRG